MNNEEKILEILQQMQGDISGLKEDVSGLKEDVADIKQVQEQHTEILRQHTEKLEEFQVCIDTLLEWADDVQVVVKVPFAKGS